MSEATVRAIHRYPVKSMGGESLREVALGGRGLPGDRSWAVRDEVRGGIRGAKRFGALMQLESRFDVAPAPEGSSPATIVFPDGWEAGTGDDDVGGRISEFLGNEVSLWPLLPADATDHYRRGQPQHEDLETELRAVFGRTPEEPLPDVMSFPPELLEFESPPGTYFDAFPLLVMTTRSLETMQKKAPDSTFDVRRFRPNFVLETADRGVAFPELEWVGRSLRLGEARIQVEMACPRCVMTTHGFADLDADPDVMRALVTEAGGELGVYARVIEAGTVRLGDACHVD